VLAPGGRLVALERRIDDIDAHGVASHGWTVEQSASFAEHCRDHGFTDVTIATRAGRSTLQSVVAHRPATDQPE
jgi:hypothetical protein